MSHRDHSTPVQEALLAQSSRHFEHAIGWISALIALLLAAFDLFLAAPIVSGRYKELGLWGLLALSVVITYFFASVGYRLIRSKPNSVGSIASPTAWFTCFGLFLVLSIAFVLAAIFKRDFQFAQGAALSGLLALLAFGAGSHFRRGRKRSAA